MFDSYAWSPLGSSVHGVSQARRLWQLPFPSPGDLPNPGTEATSPALVGEFPSPGDLPNPGTEATSPALEGEFPSPGDLPNPGTEPTSPALVGEFFTTEHW